MPSGAGGSSPRAEAELPQHALDIGNGARYSDIDRRRVDMLAVARIVLGTQDKAVGPWNAKTGEPFYERQTLPEGKAFTTSPWAVGDKIFCLSENGVCFVLRSSDKFEQLHTNTLAEDDMCMATPALAGDRLLIRTSARLYCFKKAQ